jgi:glycosyltransferase involved in cell wall biosynthesis
MGRKDDLGNPRKFGAWKLRVLHLITTIERGGAEKQLLTLVRCQVSQGIVASVVFLKGEPQLKSDFQSIGVTTHDLSRFTPLRQISLISKLTKHGFDLVHTHLPRAELLFALSQSKLPWITTRHNSEPFLPDGPSIFSPLLSRFVLRKCSTVISITEAVQSYLQKSNEVGNYKKMRVIRYGFSREKPINYQDTKKSAIHNPVRLVTISRLVPQKDIETMLKTCAVLKSKRVKFNLKIIGEGFLRRDLENLARELGVEKDVDFLGRLEDPSQVLANSDIFLLTSLYEGFGLVLLEAMQEHLPMVVCGNQATIEVLGEKYLGLTIVKDAEAIAQKIISLQDSDLRKEAISYLNSRLEDYSPELMSKRISDLYQEVLLD